jgi:Peptidase A4 family
MSERRIPKVLSNEETYKRLRVFRTPPEGFDPLKATKRQLTAYGLPHPPERKTHPRQAALWREHMADRPEYIVPEFRIDRSSQRMGGYRRERGLPWAPPPDHPFFTFDKRFVTRPDLIRDDFLLIRNLSPQTSNNWSGAYVNQPPTEPFNNVYATFNVPYAQPPPSAWNGKSWTDGIYHAVTWVGLDGWNGPDVMQAGVMSQATVTKGSVSTMYYAWVEFFPTPWIQVANFPVSPGDMIALTVCAPFTTTHAVAMFSNKTSGQATNVGFDAPAGTVLTGVVAEWIVENPSTTPAGTFANYGNVQFHECIAGSKTQERDLRSATRINMVDGSGAVVSTGWLQTRSELSCSYGP